MKVLVVAAHMDDEVLGAGATIARHVRDGDEVTVSVVCKRAYDHVFDPVKVEQERDCCRKAAAALGVRDLRFFDLRDELLDERLLDVIVPIERVVRDVRPDVVYTHHRGDINQDHRAVFHATMIACRPVSAASPQRLLCFESVSATEFAPPFVESAFLPTVYVDVSATLEQKTAALACYARELREFPHPRSKRGVETLAAKRGMECGMAAAEAFMLVRERR